MSIATTTGNPNATPDRPTQATHFRPIITNTPGGNPACSVSSGLDLAQASYEGILPGHTTVEELTLLWGKPNRTHLLGENEIWVYEPPTPSITLRNNVVERIEVGPTIAGRQTIGEMVKQYGCPELVFAVDTTMHKAGLYNETLFVMPRLGIDFLGENYPPQLADKVSGISYYTPLSVDIYISERSNLSDGNFAEQVFWHSLFR